MANFKKDFPLLSHHSKLVYFDSAATSQKPKVVIEAEKFWYENLNANIKRGAYDLAERATEEYEKSRQTVAEFLGVAPANIIFTKGATEAINLVAQAWGLVNLHRNDVILLTEMEHHANLVPWQLVAQATGAKLRFWPINQKGELIFNDLTKLLANVKLISLCHVSNVLGTINPVGKIIKLAKAKTIPVFVDGAQAVGHRVVNLKKMDPDWYCFSGHKILGPTGIGVLYAKKERLTEMTTYQTGGSMVYRVTFQHTTFAHPPAMFEAGTQPLAQVYALAKAVQYLNKQEVIKIQKHCQALTNYTYQQLAKIKDVTIFGPRQRGDLISFVVENLHPHDLSSWLNEYGIALRAGHHCAQPLHDKLGVPATARISFHCYNSRQEIDYFIKVLRLIIKQWKGSINKK